MNNKAIVKCWDKNKINYMVYAQKFHVFKKLIYKQPWGVIKYPFQGN